MQHLRSYRGGCDDDDGWLYHCWVIMMTMVGRICLTPQENLMSYRGGDDDDVVGCIIAEGIRNIKGHILWDNWQGMFYTIHMPTWQGIPRPVITQ